MLELEHNYKEQLHVIWEILLGDPSHSGFTAVWVASEPAYFQFITSIFGSYA